MDCPPRLWSCSPRICLRIALRRRRRSPALRGAGQSPEQRLEVRHCLYLVLPFAFMCLPPSFFVKTTSLCFHLPCASHRHFVAKTLPLPCAFHCLALPTPFLAVPHCLRLVISTVLCCNRVSLPRHCLCLVLPTARSSLRHHLCAVFRSTSMCTSGLQSRCLCEVRSATQPKR